MKKKLAILVSLLMAMTCLALTACGSQEEATEETTEAATETTAAAVDASQYGYLGDDPVEAAVYEYLATETAKDYELDSETISIPNVIIINTKEGANGETDVYGDFWIMNYKVEGDTLKCVSGGNYPGVMHVAADGDACKVTSFDQVGDGSNFEPTAREIFGDDYDAFMKEYSDDKANEKSRAKILADYVKANGLEVTKYQDEGWDPIDLAL